MSEALSLIAEPSRRRILRLVWTRERTAGDIAAEMPVTFGAVSQHLRLLRDGGLVSVRPDGRRRWYLARREALGPLAAALEAMWEESLARLRDVAEREEAARPPRRARVALAKEAAGLAGGEFGNETEERNAAR